MQFTQEQLRLITHCAQVASERFTEDARVMREAASEKSNVNQRDTFLSLGDTFARYAKDARELVEYIEENI